MRKSLATIKNPSKLKENRRKLSIRKKVSGTERRPRICAFRSNTNIFVQVINDELEKTIFSVQTYGKDAVGTNSNTESAVAVGAKVAAMLKKSNIETAVFDRNGKKYTGVIAKLAETIRENGIRI
jgi:large subunit ribosomal protein L18